ncbi:MAG: hypothetical protein FJ020_02020 [Chloroflexi bacterium]|nr:hypothetical protein [Chloroflexota bacterium]
MSKLMKRLRQVCECAPPPMGFKKGAAQPNRQMALVASLPPGGRRLAGGLNLAEIDAVLIHGGDLAGEGALQEITAVLGQTPWGVWLGHGASPDLEKIVESGADFIALESSQAAGLLQEDLGSILKVDLSGDRFLLGAVGDLPVDAVLMYLGQGGGDLTIADILRCGWLAGLVDKPLLVAPGRELSDKEMRLIWDAGVSGLVVPVADEQGREVLSRLFQIIKDLPARTRKRSEDHIFLPSVDVESDED